MTERKKVLLRVLKAHDYDGIERAAGTEYEADAEFVDTLIAAGLAEIKAPASGEYATRDMQAGAPGDYKTRDLLHVPRGRKPKE